MNPAKDAQINYLNMGLMALSALLAYFLPFETFLFAYAFLGPLHYLTEISWLHDRNYFSKGKYDFIVLLVIGVLLSYAAFAKDFGINVDFYESFVEANLFDKLLVFALFSAVLFALVENIFVKIISILLLFVFISGWLSPERAEINRNSTTIFALTSLVPTLIHVYIFTGLFMLYGALKSRSKTGLISVVSFILFPVILVFYAPVDTKSNFLSDYGKKAYYADGEGFFSTNISILDHFDIIDDPIYTNKDFIGFVQSENFQNGNKANKFISDDKLSLLIDSLSKIGSSPYLIRSQPVNSGIEVDNLLLLIDQNGSLLEYRNKPIPCKLIIGYNKEKYDPLVFFSTIGIMLMRFIAFAYLYHYLNWFSKTEVIRWHKVPKIRFAAVIILWLLACGAYAYDYSIGLNFLFFLSFTHVLLEFPLNIVSIVGIGTESFSILKNGFSFKAKN
jgi:hypothetical protein